MAYFLKKSTQQGRSYLAIYESFYSPEVNGTKHKCVQSLGNIETLKKSGIEDPVSFYQNEVNKLNEQRKLETPNKKFNQKLISDISPEVNGTKHKCVQSLGNIETLKKSGIEDPVSFYQNEVNKLNEQRKLETPNKKFNQKLISDISPERYLGYFPLANVLNTLDVKEHFNYMQSTRNFHFNVFDVFSSLVFARAVAPLSKHRTFHDVLPSILKKVDFSYDQLLETVEFVGSEYEKFVEIFTVATQDNYGIDTRHTYFDCTNFYFEIDKESIFQKKGPSKENKHDPIIGLGLLLDSNMIPIGMKMYPGNESEKPILRKTIRDLKNRNNIDGRTIQIADKGLNCAKNIIDATDNCDGYIFSKSVKTLPQVEKTWVLNDDGYIDVCDSSGEVHYRYKSCIDEFEYSYFDEEKQTTIKRKLKEKRVVTFNPKLQKKKLMEIDKMIEKAKKMRASQAKKDEYGECAKYMSFVGGDGKKASVVLNEEAIEKDRSLAGFNMLVTSEYRMKDQDIYDAYHNLWRIEESFRVMKSELDARPVYLQKEDSIKGHFLICYVTVLLLRIFQFKILENKYSTSEICNFIREFRVVKINENRYINMTRASKFITDLAYKLGQPITNYYLNDRQIKMMHSR